MSRRKDEDRLVALVVAAALAVLALTLWAGGRRLYSRWQAGQADAVKAPKATPGEDGVDRPPPFIPPLAMAGIAPAATPARPRPKPPAALPMPPITPDRE